MQPRRAEPHPPYRDSAAENGGVIESNENGDGFTFVFRPSLDGNTALNEAMFGNGASDNSLTIVVKLVKEDGTVLRSFKYTDELVGNTYGGEKQAFQITVRKLDATKHGTIKVVYGLESDTGLMCEIEAATFTPTAVPEA